MKAKQAVLALTVAAALATGAAACGGSSSGSAKGNSGSSSGGGSNADNGIDKLAAKDIAVKSLQTLKDAGAVKVAGQITSSGQQVSLDLSIDTAANCSGTMGVGGQGSFQLVKRGSDIWFKPDQTFWTSHGGAAVAQLVGGKNLKTTAANPEFAEVASLCDLNQIADPGNLPAVLATGPRTTVDGQEVVPVSGDGENGHGTLYVATHGKPYPLRLEQTGTDNGKIDFSAFGVPVPTATPAADQTIDYDELQRENGGGASPSTSSSGSSSGSSTTAAAGG